MEIKKRNTKSDCKLENKSKNIKISLLKLSKTGLKKRI
jgi:hypothetical protein